LCPFSTGFSYTAAANSRPQARPVEAVVVMLALLRTEQYHQAERGSSPFLEHIKEPLEVAILRGVVFASHCESMRDM
jgi:hypothetical protein